ncbi:MAG: tRNA sulfurtransferase, partial [Thermoanaerobaculia bacterium]
MKCESGPRHVLIHYNEIALKGRNRRAFEERLIAGVQRALAGLPVARVKRLYGRILAEFSGEIPWDEARPRLARVFGVAHFGRAYDAPCGLEAIREALSSALADMARGGNRSFAIVSRRPDKGFPLNSMELNRELGRFVQERTGWKVSLDAPDLPIYVWVLHDAAFIALERCAGAGGLPARSGGRVVCLISGGIDSPVAAHRMMRRGCEPIFIHFHSFPHTSRASIDKVKAIVAALLRDRGWAFLH